MRYVIDNFRNLPGQHCGSTALRNLLWHYYGLDLPEAVVFGLGAGCDFYVIPGSLPMMSGRSVSLEADACVNLGLPYREIIEPDNDKAWQDVRKEVAAGRPVMLTGDIYYLDYRPFKYHFPAHRFVLVGFDEERQEAYIMDRIHGDLETCSTGALARSRNPPEGISTFNLWGKFDVGDESRGRDLDEAVRLALRQCAARMLGYENNPSPLMLGLRSRGPIHSGVAAIREWSDRIQHWKVLDNAADIARFQAENIEKFGNGGGLFRNLYAAFLQWAFERFPHLTEDYPAELAASSASLWTRLSGQFAELAEPGASPNLWQEASTTLYQIYRTESTLFEAIWEHLPEVR